MADTYTPPKVWAWDAESGGRFANIAISRLAESARFNEAEVCLLRAALPLVESFLFEYWQRYGSNVEQGGSELYGQLESAFRVFGTSGAF